MTTIPTIAGDIVGNAELVGSFEHDSPEWHEARAAVIGSSDIAAILGLSSFKSAFTLWHEKAGLVEPPTPDRKLQRKFDYGHHMEPFIARLFMDEHPDLMLMEGGSWRNVARPWQGCNPDRLAWDGNEFSTLTELKTFPYATDWADGPYPGYRAQLLWQMDVFGFRSGYLVGYANMSGDLLTFEYDMDDFEMDSMRRRALEFADSITAGNPPDIDGTESTYQTLRRLNPSITPKAEIEIPSDIAEAYLEARAAAKAADSDITKWKGHLLAHMGTAQYAMYDGRKIAARQAVKDGIPFLKEA